MVAPRIHKRRRQFPGHKYIYTLTFDSEHRSHRESDAAIVCADRAGSTVPLERKCSTISFEASCQITVLTSDACDSLGKINICPNPAEGRVWSQFVSSELKTGHVRGDVNIFMIRTPDIASGEREYCCWDFCAIKCQRTIPKYAKIYRPPWTRHCFSLENIYACFLRTNLGMMYFRLKGILLLSRQTGGPSDGPKRQAGNRCPLKK
jgi:hypothetical protein